MDPLDIQHRFEFHPVPVGAEGLERAQQHAKIRRACATLAFVINDTVPDGREKSLAITNLEEVMYWANAALARVKHA